MGLSINLLTHQLPLSNFRLILLLNIVLMYFDLILTWCLLVGQMTDHSL